METKIWDLRSYRNDIQQSTDVLEIKDTVLNGGLVALPTCVVNPGETVLLPDPGYTDYLAGVMLADANPVPLELEPLNYLPD